VKMWLICCCFLNESRPFGRSGGNNGGLRVIEEGFRRLVDDRGIIGRWRRRRIGSVMVVLASFSVFYAWRDFRLDELWVENSFMSERSRCCETPN
jgi:hypothetical protein